MLCGRSYAEYSIFSCGCILRGTFFATQIGGRTVRQPKSPTPLFQIYTPPSNIASSCCENDWRSNFWQYAKIISESAVFGKRNWGCVTKKFLQLRDEEIFWNEIREYVKERETSDECIFCGSKAGLTIDHLLPRLYNGPNDEKNKQRGRRKISWNRPLRE